MVARRVLMFLLLFPRWPAHSQIPSGYRQIAEQENVPAEALYSLALTESAKKLAHGVRPWPWTINVAGIGYRYASRDEAYQALLGFIRRYPLKRIDVGVAQVNLGWNGSRFSSYWHAFDPTPICASRRGSYANATTPNREAGCRPPVVTIILRAASRPASIKRLFNAI